MLTVVLLSFYLQCSQQVSCFSSFRPASLLLYMTVIVSAGVREHQTARHSTFLWSNKREAEQKEGNTIDPGQTLKIPQCRKKNVEGESCQPSIPSQCERKSWWWAVKWFTDRPLTYHWLISWNSQKTAGCDLMVAWALGPGVMCPEAVLFCQDLLFLIYSSVYRSLTPINNSLLQLLTATHKTDTFKLFLGSWYRLSLILLNFLSLSSGTLF